MTDKSIDLSKIAQSDDASQRIAEKLQGSSADTEALWGEDFSASGGKAPPPSGSPEK